MKKILYTLLLLPLFVRAQDEKPPAGLINVFNTFYVTADGQLWIYKGPVKGWNRMARYSDLLVAGSGSANVRTNAQQDSATAANYFNKTQSDARYAPYIGTPRSGVSPTQVRTNAQSDSIYLNATSLQSYAKTLTPTPVKTANYTASVNDLVLVNPQNAQITVSLPANATDKSLIGVKSVYAGIRIVGVVPASGDSFFGGGTLYYLRTGFQTQIFQYQASTHTWLATVTNFSTTELDKRYAQPLAISIYDKGFWTTTGDFTNGGTITSSVTANNEINISGGTGYLSLSTLTNNDENRDYEIIASIATIGSGFGVGFRSTNTSYNPSVIGVVNTSTSTISLNDITGTGLSGATNVALPTTLAVGDVVKLRISQRGNRIVLYCEVNRSGTIFQHSISAIGNLTATRNFSLPNASNPVFYSYGGSANIRSIRITSSSQFGTDIAIIGDSKVQGYSAGNINLRYASLLNSLGNVTAFGGDGDGTASCVSTIPYIVNYIKPKQVLLAIGSNDIRGGVAAVTWQANYNTIVSTLQANGINVIHLLPVPEGGGLDQSALYNFIVNTYGAQNCIDPSLNWQAGYNSTDNVHPNSIGHRKIANDIVASGRVGTTNIANYSYPENNNLLDALPKTGNGSVVLNNNSAFTGTTSMASVRLTNIPTGSAGTDSLLVKSASTNLVQKIAANYYAAPRGHVIMSASITGLLNYDYLNNTTSTYTITVPTTTGFATDGSSIITALQTGTGTIRIACPTGYTLTTPSGPVTPSTGYASIAQNQKVQLIPIGANAWYIQPLNGSITVN